MTMTKSLADIVAAKPFHEFGEWWPMGDTFVTFMADAIGGEWRQLCGNAGDLTPVKAYVHEYVNAVFQRPARPTLVEEFYHQRLERPIESGEFDALSYAFYRSAFELIANHAASYEFPVERERRLFTKRVGKRFFSFVESHVALALPDALASDQDVTQLEAAIEQIGGFLKEQGYLRTHFAFPLRVQATHNGQAIDQTPDQFLEALQNNGVAYALYEMGHPAILPSAVYLYHTLGEAQHHSSRTIEELFDRIGFEARETDDFDPIGYPADRVVELWEIRPQL